MLKQHYLLIRHLEIVQLNPTSPTNHWVLKQLNLSVATKSDAKLGRPRLNVIPNNCTSLKTVLYPIFIPTSPLLVRLIYIPNNSHEPVIERTLLMIGHYPRKQGLVPSKIVSERPDCSSTPKPFTTHLLQFQDNIQLRISIIREKREMVALSQPPFSHKTKIQAPCWYSIKIHKRETTTNPVPASIIETLPTHDSVEKKKNHNWLYHKPFKIQYTDKSLAFRSLNILHYIISNKNLQPPHHQKE